MATSGTHDYAPNMAQIRQDAMEMAGGDVYGETDPAVTASADSSLNALIQALNANKTDVHVIIQSTLDTVAGTSAYNLLANAIGIDMAYLTVGESSYPLRPLTKDQYYGHTLKASIGRPDAFYHDRQSNKLYLSPVPDAVYEITYGLISRHEDMVDDSNNFDYPVYAMEMLTFGLAHRLAIKRSLPADRIMILKNEFEQARKSYIVAASNYTKGQTSTSTMVV